VKEITQRLPPLVPEAVIFMTSAQHSGSILAKKKKNSVI
jgi:hypothetical protein